MWIAFAIESEQDRGVLENKGRVRYGYPSLKSTVSRMDTFKYPVLYAELVQYRDDDVV